MLVPGPSAPGSRLPSPLKQFLSWFLPPAVVGGAAQVMTAYGGTDPARAAFSLLGAACMFGAAGVLALVFVRYGKDFSELGRRRANHYRGLGLGSLIGGYLLSPAGVQRMAPDSVVAGGLVLLGALAWLIWMERQWRLTGGGS